MRRPSLLLRCLAPVLLAACTGAIDGGPGSGSGSTDSGGGGGSPPGGTPGGGPSASCPAGAARAPALHARMLSPRQYENTVLDLLGVGGHPAQAFGGGADTQLDELGAERRANAAAVVARQAATQMGSWSPCAGTEADCESRLIDQVGKRAFRHPLSAVERQQMTALFDAGKKEKGFTSGVEWLLTGLLQSPDFLYLLVKPAAAEKAGEVQPVTGYEMASRLSYFLWDSMPDESLFAAAGAPAGLGTVASVQEQLTRMRQDPRFLRGVGGFYAHWLALGGFDELARDDKAFTTDLVQALSTSLLMNATQLYARPSPLLSALLTGESYFMNGSLRTFYGKGSGAAEFTAVDLPGEDRHGILTHPGLMAALARPQKTHPINRGLFVRTKLLCQELHPPDGVEIPDLPEVPMAGVTTRQEVSAHSTNPVCAGCHALIDPAGFALEGFDQVGRHRTMENGKPVDTAGTMVSSGDLDGPFARGEELLTKVSRSATVRSCFAQQYFQFVMAGDSTRPVGDGDRCSLAGVDAGFSASGDLDALVRLIATSDSFRFRLSEGRAL
jgi:hypothetical protein